MAEPSKEKAAGKTKLVKGRHASAIKRAKQSLKRQARNLAADSKMNTFIKRVRKAIEGKNKKEAEAALKAALPQIAKAKTKGVVHAKTAARYASRLTKAVQQI